MFTIYEDEGDNYNYEEGKSARISLQWDNKAKTLIIGDRKGSFDNMARERDFRVVVVSEGKGVGVDESSNVDKTVRYAGQKLKVML